MQEKSVTLTPNKRLSRHLQKQFCEAMALQNQVCWRTIKVLPLTAWLIERWHISPDPRILLTPFQEKILWQTIITEHLGENFNDLAELAMDFHTIVNNWQLKEQEYSNQATTEDLLIFQTLYQHFGNYCKNKNLVTTSELATLIIPYLPSYHLTTITFTGFDEYHPQLQTLITALEKTGCTVTKHDPNTIQNITQKIIGFDKLSQEIAGSAAWAKQVLDNNPKSKIGIIVPNLVELRAKITQTFVEILGDTKNLNISAGLPLTTIPIINQALKLLSLTDPSKIPERSHNKEWSQVFTKILRALGWPGKHPLTALESAAIHHFAKILPELATADLVIGKTSYHQALIMLQTLVAGSTLQPESETDASINIIGTLEACGINFDYLWMVGLDEENWPAAPKPHPFIPIALQKKLSLPHSSAERELHFCQTLINRYQRSAKELIFSYVKQQGDRTIAPSSLLAKIPEVSSEELNLSSPPSWAKQIYDSQILEAILDDRILPLIIDKTIHTPSRLLELQSACPFRACMEFRFQTQEPPKSTLGISKINRGIVVHEILEQFWQEVQTQQQLCALNPQELQNLLDKLIEKSLTKLDLPKTIDQLEHQCLAPLLAQLLELEKKREPFKIAATEKSVIINLASLPIRLRIDRIDQLADGSLILLDYKTGKNLPTVFDWFNPRPKNLQLPLYSVAINTITGLALIQINHEATKIKNIGLKELAGGFPKSDPTWPELIKYWEEVLTKLAQEFVTGIASVTPASPQTCKHCSFSSVCRIQA